MNSYLYPSPTQLRSLCVWMTDGTTALDVTSGPGIRTQDTRAHHLRQLRYLAERLDLPDVYADMTAPRDTSGPMDEWLDRALRDELYRQCRRWGYVLEEGTAVPPLGSRRMQMLTRISWGFSYEQVADAMGVTKSSVSKSMRLARDMTETETLAELVSFSYRNGWLPVNGEIRQLSESGGYGEMLSMLGERRSWRTAP